MLFPINKYLVVEPIEDDPDPSAPTVLVPAGVETATSRFVLVKLIEASVNSNLSPGMELVVHRHMLEEAVLKRKTYHLLPESQVVGFLGDKE
tara:strand:- start:208 stop:483 length:276 start_codon:yes stop_codon:yes gene_type:complete